MRGDAYRSMGLSSTAVRRFYTGPRVFGRAPKLPIGAAGIPHVRAVANLNDFPVTQTHDGLVKFRGIQKTSLESDSQWKFNLEVSSSFQELKEGDSFNDKLFISIRKWKM